MRVLLCSPPRGTNLRLAIAAVAAAIGVAGAALHPAPAAASVVDVVYANYKVTFSGSSSEDVFAGATYTMPAADDTVANATITGCCDFSQGSFSFSYQPVFFYGLPANTPVVNTLYSLSWLGQTPSSDPSQLHLVISVNSAYAPNLIGESFDQAFSGFTPAFGDVPGGGSFSEEAVVDQLLYTAGLDQDFGLPPSPFSGPTTNLLYDLGVYLNEQGGSIVGGKGFTLVAFSVGQSLGVGQATLVPVGSATPEPGGWLLMITGMLGLGSAIRLRRRRLAAA